MRLELFFDVVSPWSYLCFEALCRRRLEWGLDLVLRPAFLGGVMKATGNSPPASLPARGVYLMHDLARSSRYFDVPLTFPSEFPANTLMVMRLLCLVRSEDPGALERVSRAFWRRYWGQGLSVSNDDDLAAVMREEQLDPALQTRLGDSDVKQLLRDATDEAVSRGAFGFPAMFVRGDDGEDQLYFGSDRLALLAFDFGLPWNGPTTTGTTTGTTGTTTMTG
jgi:glutathione S-transferase kappa 1